MMKKILAVTAFVLLTASSALTQNLGSSYKNALGVKVYPGGVSYKHFFNERNAGELLGYFWTNGFRVTGLYEIHNDIRGAEGLKWYIGPGAHIGVFYTKYKNAYPAATGSYAGIDGVLGLDYKIKGAPLNVSIDWQPSFTFGDYLGFDGGWGGLGIRYAF